MQHAFFKVFLEETPQCDIENIPRHNTYIHNLMFQKEDYLRIFPNTAFVHKGIVKQGVRLTKVPKNMFKSFCPF